jgi:hypothetical protein
VTHRFALDEIMKAYDTFGNAGAEHALKVILTNPAQPSSFTTSPVNVSPQT